jgi:hypothetical protein
VSERKSGLGEYHGGASDRGAADSYYDRPKDPHFWPNGTGHGTRVEAKDMTPEELVAYDLAYNDNEFDNNKKDWG